MTQHHFPAKLAGGRAAEVLIGYDRPLHGFFLVVTAKAPDTATEPGPDGSADEDGDGADEGDLIVYSNLDDIGLIDLGGLPLDLDYFKNKLALLAIALPATIEHELQEDRRQRVGNRFCRYDSTGQALSGPQA